MKSRSTFAEIVTNHLIKIGRYILLTLTIFFIFFFTSAGLYLLDIVHFKGYTMTGGLFLLSMALALALTVDSSRKSENKDRKDNISSLQELIAYNRTAWILAVFIIMVATLSLVNRFWPQDSLDELTTPFFSAKWGNATAYHFPISPHVSWQNTHIPLKKGQTFFVYVSGLVSTGQLFNAKYYIDALNAWIEKGRPENPDLSNFVFPWKFTGPVGYPEKFYLKEKDELDDLKLVSHYSQDTSLTVIGKPHNSVLGVIIEEEEGISTRKALHTLNWSESKTRSRLFDFSAEESDYPLVRTADRSGTLWVVINDSDIKNRSDIPIFRIDNAGLFFLKIVVK